MAGAQAHRRRLIFASLHPAESKRAQASKGTLTRAQIIALIKRYAGQGPPGPEGKQGPPGQNGIAGAAGGALAGAYPNPQLAAESVDTANFKPTALAPKAADAQRLGGLPPSGYQALISGSCSGDSAIHSIAPAGTVTCQPTGTITGITTSGGLTGGGSSGSVNLGVDATKIQSRVSGSCKGGEAVSSVEQSGGVNCTPVIPTGSAGGALTGLYPNPELSVSSGVFRTAYCENGEAVKPLANAPGGPCWSGVMTLAAKALGGAPDDRGLIYDRGRRLPHISRRGRDVVDPLGSGAQTAS